MASSSTGSLAVAHAAPAEAQTIKDKVAGADTLHASEVDAFLRTAVHYLSCLFRWEPNMAVGIGCLNT